MFNNHAAYGGGIYVSTDSEANVINGFTADDGSEIHHNTASAYGGGVRVWGQFNGNGNYSDIYENCAPHGGGFDVPGGTLSLNAADVYLNQAVDATSQGGGIRVTSGGEVNLSNGAYVYYLNEAYDGAGIFADNSQITLTGGATTLRDNVATHNGGAVYLTNGSLLQSTDARHGGGFYVPGGSLYINSADTYLNQAADANGLGGGIYLTNSGVVTLTNGAYVYYLNQAYNGAGIYADNAQVYLNGGATTLRDNVAANNGGAVYLNNGSTLHSSGARIGQAGSSLANEALNGAGIYASTSTVDFTGGYIINNIATTSGGGIYASDSTSDTYWGSSRWYGSVSGQPTWIQWALWRRVVPHRGYSGYARSHASFQ